MRLLCSACAALLSLAAAANPACAARDAEYVIHVSVDGMGASYLQALIDAGQVPTFKRIQSEGAWTNNARTDFDYTVTLPNHTCMITCRPVFDKTGAEAAFPGHQWVNNGEPGDSDLRIRSTRELDRMMDQDENDHRLFKKPLFGH